LSATCVIAAGSRSYVSIGRIAFAAGSHSYVSIGRIAFAAGSRSYVTIGRIAFAAGSHSYDTIGRIVGAASRRDCRPLRVEVTLFDADLEFVGQQLNDMEHIRWPA